MPAATYLDLLNPDGSRNHSAFCQILARRIEQEINLRLCIAAGLQTPRDISFGEIPAWRREQAADLDPALLSKAERARIFDHERDELDAWVRAMELGAGKQRDGMRSAYLQAAE